MPSRFPSSDGAGTSTSTTRPAEDFQRLFGLGDGQTISTVDADGVLMAAMQGIARRLEEKDAEIAVLMQANAELEARLAALEARLAETSP